MYRRSHACLYRELRPLCWWCAHCTAQQADMFRWCNLRHFVSHQPAGMCIAWLHIIGCIIYHFALVISLCAVSPEKRTLSSAVADVTSSDNVTSPVGVTPAGCDVVSTRNASMSGDAPARCELVKAVTPPRVRRVTGLGFRGSAQNGLFVGSCDTGGKLCLSPPYGTPRFADIRCLGNCVINCLDD